MSQDEILLRIREEMKQRFIDEPTGHDWWHIYRVWQMAKYIASNEPQLEIDYFILEAGALLHDIADWKFHAGDEMAGPHAARTLLEEYGVDNQIIGEIETIVKNISFKGAKVADEPLSNEGKIVYDADKLDAIGAVGIARVFAYGGANGRSIHDPMSKPHLHESFTAYKNSKSPSIQHFYEKLLLIKDRLYTATAKSIGIKRHEYMVAFLEEFFSEWDTKS